MYAVAQIRTKLLILIKENPCLTSPKDPAPSLEMTWKHWLKYRSLLCSL